MIPQPSSKLSSSLTAVVLLHLCLCLAVSQFESSCDFDGEGASESRNGSLCEYICLDVLFCKFYSGKMEVTTDDVISYVGGSSQITINPNFTEPSNLYYKLCYSYNFSSGVIECIHNGTTRYNWTKNGEAVLVAGAFTTNYTDFNNLVACASTNITIAVNGGLFLTVVVVKDTERDSLKSGGRVQSDLILPTGNISFIISATPSNGTAKRFYYSLDFGDGSSVANIPSSTVSHYYASPGEYAFTVEAIAVVTGIQAYRAVHSGNITLLDAIHSIDVEVNGNGSVKAGSRVEMILSANGSTPIKVCWSIEQAHNGTNYTDTPTTTTDTPTASTTALPLQSCSSIINSSSSANTSVVFDTAGEFIIRALFENAVSSQQGTFKVTVQKDSPPSPAVVASSFTVAVVVAVLVAVAIVTIVVITGGYIPYRRYRKRTTETANFRFVDLSDRRATLMEKGRTVVAWVHRTLSGRRRPERVGLVNLGDVPLEDQPLYRSDSDSMAAYQACRDSQET